MPPHLRAPGTDFAAKNETTSRIEPQQRHDVESHEAVHPVARVAVVVLVDDQAVVEVVDGGEPADGDRPRLDEHAQGDQPRHDAVGLLHDRSSESPRGGPHRFPLRPRDADVVHPGRGAETGVSARSRTTAREGRRRRSRCTGQPTRRALLHAHPAVHPRPGARSPAARPRAAASPPASPSPSARRSTATSGSGTPSTTTCPRSPRRRPACSSPTSARRRSTIRLGAGGVMLPNHSPLTIAEQFGTLDAMYPGRIDLGLGRAPGSDQNTMYALRRDPTSADTLPAGRARAAGLPGRRDPGARRRRRSRARARACRSTSSGSSMFGATLAAALGLPYAFASHFAPQVLEAAVAAYRREFRPSEQLDRPYVIAGVNVLAADTTRAGAGAAAGRRAGSARSALFGRGQALTDEQADQLLAQGAGAARRPDAHLRRRRHAGRGRRLPRRLRASRPTPTS